ncbi:MAG: hypothetical protein JWO71_525 [Candidatus Acidoferrum typicum]|nr:hypothetical protein [Candidatus Acidoferrum typicum]
MKDKQNRSFEVSFKGTAALTLVFGTALLIAPLGRTLQKGQQQDSMPGMDMGANGDMDMSSMGPSMAAMAGHMYMTPLRPKQPGDQEKAAAVVAAAKATLERYKDYRKALLDGYAIANPKLKQPQYHFISQANTREADLHFDPSKPTALLYRRTPTQEYKLEGMMYTASPDATEDELNQRIPLSMVRWHRHINYCEAPEDRISDYQAAHPKFGMFGSINTEEACRAERGIFHAHIFTWMIHVFPYERDFKDVFSMNDDVAHVH